MTPTTTAPESGADPASSRRRRRWWLQTLGYVAVAVVLALVVRTFVAQIYVIPSESMEPTIQAGDRLLVNKLATAPVRGDVVVFELPGEATSSAWPGPLRPLGEALGLAPTRTDLVKRVIAVEGEEIEISAGSVVVDGRRLAEDYLAYGSRLADFGPLVVPAGQVFLMGDHRNRSRDSRAYGTVSVDQILGTAVAVIWPPTRWRSL